jgi:hypothetical protein
MQDIGESETHELDGMYKPLLQGLLAAVLTKADLTNQGVPQEGLDLKQLVSDKGSQHHAAVYAMAPCFVVLFLCLSAAMMPMDEQGPRVPGCHTE